MAIRTSDGRRPTWATLGKVVGAGEPCGGTIEAHIAGPAYPGSPGQQTANGGAVAFTPESDLAAGLAHRGQLAERRLLTGEVLRSALGEPSRSCRSYSTAASMWDGRARASPGVIGLEHLEHGADREFESRSLRQHGPCGQSLRLLIGPEKPKNWAVFRGWLCTLDWRQRLGIAL